MVSRQLRIARKQNNLTQTDVANILGVDRTTYIAYEKGTRDIGTAKLGLLCKFLKIDSNIFYQDITKQYAEDDDYFENQPDTRFLSQLSKEELKLIINFRKMSKDNREKILGDAAEKADEKN